MRTICVDNEYDPATLRIMAATVPIRTFPTTAVKLKRIAKKRRWTLAVAMDEAVHALADRERDRDDDSSSDDTNEELAPTAA